MKKRHSGSNSIGARKVACTVSAAALMLGACPAATVGLHFQVDYCGDGRYTGIPVTLTAFGIGPNSWENLSEMITGYSCTNVCSFNNLSQVVATNTSGGGLNPLPNGSLTVNWGASSANFSGFGGYGAFGIYGTYGYDNAPPGQPGGPNVPIPTGEFQIYSAFLRDGVEFGPVPPTCGGPSGGDNNQPGYTIDITGLKSLFTNSPFAIELIAASDSMQYLTNAFIIDATLSITQSVTYPNTAFPPENEGGTSGWFRGHGGGLSTASGSLNTDHVQIIGNRADHGNTGGNGFDNASTISGFIITDKPVISMSPQPVLVSDGDTITWSAYAVGVPPLSYQWRKNGTPIPGATSLSYSITNVGPANLANYDLLVTNLYGSATSSVVTVDHIVANKGSNLVIDSNPKGPEHDGLDIGATWLASSTDSRGTNRTGVMSFNPGDPDQITVPGSTNFNSTTGTIMFWMRSPGTTNLNNAVIFDRSSGTGLTAELYNGGNLFIGASNAVGFLSATTLYDTNWHHIALVYDQSVSGQLSCYIDGVADANSPAANFGAWSWPSGQSMELGLSQYTSINNTTVVPYNGLLDDFRIYSRELTAGEVASVHSSDALVDTNTLVLQFNFTTAPTGKGVVLTWQTADVILQTAPTVLGPWTDVGAPGTTNFPVVTGKSAQFFRYHGHVPVTLVSNPYLM